MINQNKKKILINFKKANSHLSNVTDMVEQDHYCIEVMQQNLAIIGLLRSAHEMLMTNHFHTCFKSAMQTKNQKKKEQMTNEILKVMNIYNK